jgi:hypothetical protein
LKASETLLKVQVRSILVVSQEHLLEKEYGKETNYEPLKRATALL